MTNFRWFCDELSHLHGFFWNGTWILITNSGDLICWYRRCSKAPPSIHGRLRFSMVGASTGTRSVGSWLIVVWSVEWEWGNPVVWRKSPTKLNGLLLQTVCRTCFLLWQRTNLSLYWSSYQIKTVNYMVISRPNLAVKVTTHVLYIRIVRLLCDLFTYFLWTHFLSDWDLVAVPFKRFCEMRVGVTSQCMVKPRQLNDQYFGNLALKINLKVKHPTTLQR